MGTNVSNQKIAVAMLAFLASGGTLESAVTGLPQFKSELDAILDWMKSNAHCSFADMERDAARLREIVGRKEEAIKASDFELAADLLDQVCGVCKPYGLKKRHCRGISGAVLYGAIERHIQDIGALLRAEQSKPTT